MSVAENIKKIRISRNLTQQELADAVDVKQPYIAQIERGSKIPTLTLGKQIADALGCSLYDFFDDNESKKAV